MCSPRGWKCSGLRAFTELPLRASAVLGFLRFSNEEGSEGWKQFCSLTEKCLGVLGAACHHWFPWVAFTTWGPSGSIVQMPSMNHQGMCHCSFGIGGKTLRPLTVVPGLKSLRGEGTLRLVGCWGRVVMTSPQLFSQGDITTAMTIDFRVQ